MSHPLVPTVASVRSSPQEKWKVSWKGTPSKAKRYVYGCLAREVQLTLRLMTELGSATVKLFGFDIRGEVGVAAQGVVAAAVEAEDLERAPPTPPPTAAPTTSAVIAATRRPNARGFNPNGLRCA